MPYEQCFCWKRPANVSRHGSAPLLCKATCCTGKTLPSKMTAKLNKLKMSQWVTKLLWMLRLLWREEKLSTLIPTEEHAWTLLGGSILFFWEGSMSFLRLKQIVPTDLKRECYWAQIATALYWMLASFNRLFIMYWKYIVHVQQIPHITIHVGKPAHCPNMTTQPH